MSNLIEEMLDRFERAVSPLNVSGLGLYITRQIVEAHHGKVCAESALNKGSTFILELPLMKAE